MEKHINCLKKWNPIKAHLMSKQLLPKSTWKNGIGAAEKPRRLHLVADNEGMFYCPVKDCDSLPYRSRRGCRKHVNQRHGWYFYFNQRPNVAEVLPQQVVKKNEITKTKRSFTQGIPSFSKTCNIYVRFTSWLTSVGGSSKSRTQAEQIGCRVLKYLRFCCQDACPTWNVPYSVVDYCAGSITLLSDFVVYLESNWTVGFSGIIGYMNSLSHLLDYRRINEQKYSNNQTFMAAEIYIQRVKKSLGKKMRGQWNLLLSVEYLSTINCWATLEELQKVIPFHGDKFSQILLNASTESGIVPSHDLTFCTSFVVSVLFLMVKASRPMTFKFLTVQMIQNINSDGIIDQTVFKTKDRYGFDSLIFSQEVIGIVNGYVKCVRPRLNPSCDYLLITRNGTQLAQLSDVFGRLVFQAIGKYIHPTRYRQIIETESSQKLTIEEQSNLSEDQKHTSNVAKVHYRKQQSRLVAEKAKESMEKLRDESSSISKVQEINSSFGNISKRTTETDFTVTASVSETNKTLEVSNSKERKKKVSFSKEEDNFILKGIKKYGKGKWKAILTDPSFAFHSSRTTATLLTRAKVRKFI